MKNVSLVVPFVANNGTIEQSNNVVVKGSAQIAKDIEGLGNLKIQGTASVGKLITGIVDPYLIENDGLIQPTLEIRSTGTISLQPGNGNIELKGSLTGIKNITSTGGITSSTLTTSGDISGANITGTKLKTTGDLVVDKNITLTGVINSTRITDNKLLFGGDSPSIYAGTTNTGISLNANGTGAISIGNSSTGDIYIGGGSTSTTRCLITNSSGNLNCTGDITSGGSLYVTSGSLKTTATTGNLFNDTVTTLNIGKAGTTLSIGATSGTTTINNALTATGALTGSSTLGVTGTTSLNGAVNIGSVSTNDIAVNGRITTSIIPKATGNVDLGSSSLKWNNLYSNTINTASINTSGQGIFNQNPATTAITDASLLINPTTVTNAGSALLGIAVAGVEKARIDETGKLTLQGGLNVAGGTVTLPSSSITVSSLTPGTAGQLLISNTTPTAAFVSLSGDATLAGTGALTLANTAVTSGSYGGATAVPVLTIDSKGRITAASTASISSAWSSITNPTANLSLSMAANTSTFTYNATTSTANLFNLTDTTNNTGTGYLMNITTAAGSTLKPFHVQTTGSIDAITVLANGETGIGTNSPGSQLQINPSSTTTIGEIIKAQASQTADLLQIQNSIGSILAKIDNLGNITGNTLTSTVAQGTAPLTVTSTTQVTNLNASTLAGNTAATLLSQPQPNLVLNSDFSRRNKWMTFMPEVFSDTSGWTVDVGGAMSVSANIMTSGTLTGGVWKARAGLSTWRDARYSAAVKWAANGNAPAVMKYADSTNWVSAYLGNTTWNLLKQINGSNTTVQTISFTPTAGTWYWLELESQGTTYIAKVYSAGTGTNPVAKSSATLQATTPAGTISDSAVASGYIGLYAEAASLSWGGLSTGDGGVYVEGWGPEGYTPSWTGTLGGQAFGFDESADSGPVGKQWTLRYYIPATSRGFELEGPQTASNVPLKPSTTYSNSAYVKFSGLGGSGTFLEIYDYDYTSGLTGGSSYSLLTDNADTSWTRKTGSWTTGVSGVYLRHRIIINRLAGRTGTGFLQMAQVEEGSIATPWRNAPSDDDPIVWELVKNDGNVTNNITTYISIDDRNLGVNAFLPWDSSLEITFAGSASNGTIQGQALIGTLVDGSNVYSQPATGRAQTGAGYITNLTSSALKTVVAGKHRVNLTFASDGSTVTTIYAQSGTTYDQSAARMRVVARRGKFDLAEEYSVNDPTIGAGDVVQLASDNSQFTSNTTIERSAGGYSSKVLGIVSTAPGITLSSTVELNSYQNKPNLRPVALSGRVPVKVTNENGEINRGDFLTSSALYPGFAMRATHAGRVIGIAMDDFHPNTSECSNSNTFESTNSNKLVCTGKVLTFVNLSWYDPDVYLTDSGQFVINKTSEQPTVQLASNGTVATSPATPSAQYTNALMHYTLQNNSTKEIIERTGAFSDLFVANLKVGKLDATEIIQLTALEQRIRRLELATGSAVLSASISGLLNEQTASGSGILTSLTVTGRTILNDLGITGKISAGLLSIDGLNSSISSLSDIRLKVPGGEILIDKDGNLRVQNITAKKYYVDSSDSASSALGRGTISAGATSATVSTTAVTDKSRVFVTAKNKTGNQTLVVTENPGTGFTVSIENSYSSDINFNWWIVDSK